MQHHNNKIDAALLGKIVLARFLELPLRAVDRLAAQAESSAGFTALRPWVSVGRLEGARVVHGAADIPRIQASPILGEVHAAGRELMFLYHREAYAREYRFDEEGVNCLMARADSPAELARALRRLRLINTRNRLTHALMQAVLASQAAYLRSGQVLTLLPLTQAAISARLRSESNLSVVADPGRISRLVRGLSITLPNGKAVPLNTLFPKPRQVHCHFVDHMIKAEKTWMAEGLLRGPLTDEAIAAILEREHGIRLSRRTVANIRHGLAIPDYNSRSQRTDYLAATDGFSALVPLTAQALRTAVPPLKRCALRFRPIPACTRSGRFSLPPSVQKRKTGQGKVCRQYRTAWSISARPETCASAWAITCAAAAIMRCCIATWQTAPRGCGFA